MRLAGREGRSRCVVGVMELGFFPYFFLEDGCNCICN